MNKLYFILVLISSLSSAQIINIPDPTFKLALLTGACSDINHAELLPDTNGDGQIDVSEALNVYTIYLPTTFGSYVTTMTGIEYFTNLRYLYASGSNHSTSINLTTLVNLEVLSLYNMPIANLDLTGVPNLKNLNVDGCNLTTLNVSVCPNLEVLSFDDNNISSINVSMLPNLINLSCIGNQLTSLSIANLTQVWSLDCYLNNLTSLNLTGATGLKMLNCRNNQLTALDLTNLPLLKSVQCYTNQIASLNLIGCPLLYSLNCYDNLLTSLNLGNSPEMQYLDCSNNQLTTLNTVGLTSLFSLKFNNNQFTTFSADQLYNLQYLECNNNLLTEMNLKNGKNMNNWFSGNPTLQYICADEQSIPSIAAKITNYGYTNCHVNSYCSFVPGGQFYTISGSQRFDNDSNGCSDLDIVIPNFKISITNGVTSGGTISNSSGDFSIPVQSGVHTITPIIENPVYFTVSPLSAVFSFPTDPDPSIQDFCVTANGIHPDLEVVLVPLDAATPGFVSEYKLIYKNKGSVTLSGTVSFNYGNNVTLGSSSPLSSSQAAQVANWVFANLQPFEQREIQINVVVNSPQQTPPVNSGDVLHYVAAGTTDVTDVSPDDNVMQLYQTANNSFDPNDKTCLEGNTIEPDMVGKYVHYQIRFENTGTANAQNIVVSDMIDAAKFDSSSLIPIDGSHDFYTRINGNKVEFIFENIQLPFDDANNDGYVMFKIKTKPNLVVGNTFSNSASIYFDYNAPIVTDPAVTTIYVLGTKDFEFSNYFTIYPNPTVNDLNIQKRTDLEISSMEIYNILGQLVIAIPNAQEVSKVDVSSLTAGNYFIKINSNKGTTSTKFNKN